MNDDFMARRNAEVIKAMIEKYTAVLAEQTPPKYRNAEASDSTVLAWCRKLLPQKAASYESVSGPSLLIKGVVGTGKTHQAFGAMRWLVSRGFPNKPRVVVAVDLYASLRPQPGVNTEEVFQSYANAGLLFVDDMGAEKGSDWVEQINYRLINHRYNHELPTIVTTNVLPKDFSTTLGERTASRLNEMCDQVALKGSDRRRGTK